MIAITAALIGYSALTVLLVPALLCGRSWIVRFPRVAVAAWAAAFLSGTVSACAGVAWWVDAGLHATQPQGRVVGAVVFSSAWVVLAAVSGLLATVAGRAAADSAQHRARRSDAHTALRDCAHRTTFIGGRRVRVVSSGDPFAVGLPGRQDEIVVSARLVETLEESELEAVVQHEVAHLAMHHDLLLRATHLHEACVPIGRAPMEMHRAFALLVELIADDRAARSCGRAHLAGALRAMAGLTRDESMLLRARRLDGLHPHRA